LYEFELDRTDEALFKSHHTMLSNRQLLVAIDSIDKEIGQRVLRLEESTNRNYYFWNKAYEERIAEERRKEIEAAKLKNKKTPGDTLSSKKTSPAAASPASDTLSTVTIPPAKPKVERKITAPNPRAVIRRVRPSDQSFTAGSGARSPFSAGEADPWPRVITGNPEDFPSLALTFRADKRPLLMDKTLNMVRTLRDQAENSNQSLRRIMESRVKHVFEFHTKFSLAIACFIFLFIGAPMGAIVRKGGFGWPLLISIVFFMVFTVITIFSKNIAERFVIDAVTAAWMNCMVVFPMGLLLTYWAMRDMGWAQIRELFSWKWRIRRTAA
jgi:lipopolysaccharide export system permease protein